MSLEAWKKCCMQMIKFFFSKELKKGEIFFWSKEYIFKDTFLQMNLELKKNDLISTYLDILVKDLKE